MLFTSPHTIQSYWLLISGPSTPCAPDTFSPVVFFPLPLASYYEGIGQGSLTNQREAARLEERSMLCFAHCSCQHHANNNIWAHWQQVTPGIADSDFQLFLHPPQRHTHPQHLGTSPLSVVTWHHKNSLSHGSGGWKFRCRPKVKAAPPLPALEENPSLPCLDSAGPVFGITRTGLAPSIQSLHSHSHQFYVSCHYLSLVCKFSLSVRTWLYWFRVHPSNLI